MNKDEAKIEINNLEKELDKISKENFYTGNDETKTVPQSVFNSMERIRDRIAELQNIFKL